MNDAAAARLIKKYPNRRLYDTRTSSYITLADVKQLVLADEHFQVMDAKTNENITRTILLQIILEEETGGVPMFNADVLSQIIRFYGNAMQSMMGSFLAKNIECLLEVQQRTQDQTHNLYGENAKVNAELWSQLMGFQGPAIQTIMQAYMDQSKNLYVQLQEQLQDRTRNIFAGFTFPGLVPDSQRKGEPGGSGGSNDG